MKIEVDVLGVEQAVDFDTLASAQFVVLDVLGVRARVPISEEQMVHLTTMVMNQKAEKNVVHSPTDMEWEDPRDRSEHPLSADVISTPIPERSYGGVMAGLSDNSGETEDSPAVPEGIMQGFFEEDPAEAERKLRARKPQRRTVAADAAGNPEVTQPSAPRMPAPPGFGALSDDDGIAQG